MAEMHEIGVLPTMLPWLQDDLKRAQSILGPDVWPYGVPDNRREIEAMLRYSVEQGLSKRQVALAELFAPGTLHRVQGKDCSGRTKRVSEPSVVLALKRGGLGSRS